MMTTLLDDGALDWREVLVLAKATLAEPDLLPEDQRAELQRAVEDFERMNAETIAFFQAALDGPGTQAWDHYILKYEHD